MYTTALKHSAQNDHLYLFVKLSDGKEHLEYRVNESFVKMKFVKWCWTVISSMLHVLDGDGVRLA